MIFGSRIVDTFDTKSNRHWTFVCWTNWPDKKNKFLGFAFLLVSQKCIYLISLSILFSGRIGCHILELDTEIIMLKPISIFLLIRIIKKMIKVFMSPKNGQYIFLTNSFLQVILKEQYEMTPTSLSWFRYSLGSCHRQLDNTKI